MWQIIILIIQIIIQITTLINQYQNLNKILNWIITVNQIQVN